MNKKAVFTAIMKVTAALVVSVLFLTGCKTGIDEDLSDYVKPIIRQINPGGIIYNNMGFVLNVYSDYFENDNYVLYINKKKFETTIPNYWRYVVSWKISNEILKELLASTGNKDARLEVRITPIQSDISDDFDRYGEYISDVLYLELKRNSTTFTTPVKLFDLWENSTDPVLRNDNAGNLYLAWREKVDDIFQAFFCFSEDRGDTWSQVLNISRSTNDVTKADLAVDEAGNFFMAWSEENDGFSQVYFSRSIDHGATWYNPHRISDENENSANSCIAADPTGKIFITWTNNHSDSYNEPYYDRLWLSVSPDRGEHWGKKILMENDFIGGDPALGLGENGSVYFTCGTSDGIYFLSSMDSGNNWEIKQADWGGSFLIGHNSSLHTGLNGKFFLIWNSQNTTGHNNLNWIHFISGSDRGAAWDEMQYLDNVCNTTGTRSAMSVNGSNINMLLNGSNELFLLRSSDEGRSWSYPEFIPGTESVCYYGILDMATDNEGRIYIVYISTDESASVAGDINFLRTSENN